MFSISCNTMKFTIFALIAVLCVSIATANVNANVQPTKDDEMSILEYDPQDSAEEVVDIENFSVLGPMKKVIKAALRTLKGVNCSIKFVLKMREAAQKFIDDVHSCGGTVSKQLQAVINSCQAVISTSSDIIHLNSNVCNNADMDDDSDEKTSKACFVKLVKKMITLKKQISKTLALIKKVPQVPGQVGQCVSTALNELNTVFRTFPTFVKNCSKLTSN